MSVKTINEFVANGNANKRTYGKGTAKKKFVVIHQTGNTSKGANAKAHSNIQKNLNPREASWHETVDDTQAIVNFSSEWQCWHAGDGRGQGNLNGYAMELCINSDGDYNKTIENGAQRAAIKLKEFGLTVENGLRQHNNFDGKNCPAQIRDGKNGVTWAVFKQKVNGYMKGSTSTPAKTSKTIAQLAKEVIAGKHGNGEARKKSLGSNYDAVQKAVNASAGVKSEPAKSTLTLAKEVIAGKHGQGEARKKALGSQYTAVQKKVNELLK